MAKANLILPDGTKVKIDGSAEEVSSMISKLSHPSVTQRKNKKSEKKKGSTKTKRPSIVRDLNLQPKGKPSFKDFFQEKKPNVGNQTYTVCVYYLEKVLGIKSITQDHVYTCMKDINREIPNELDHAMQVASSRYGTIDTTNGSDITVTVPGENLVEHKLEKGKKGTVK